MLVGWVVRGHMSKGVKQRTVNEGKGEESGGGVME